MNPKMAPSAESPTNWRNSPTNVASPSSNGTLPPANGAISRANRAPITAAAPRSKNSRWNGYRIAHQAPARAMNSTTAPAPMIAIGLALPSTAAAAWAVALSSVVRLLIRRETALIRKIASATIPTRTQRFLITTPTLRHVPPTGRRG
jgi:hypothetical protein